MVSSNGISSKEFTEDFEILCKSYIGKHKKCKTNSNKFEIIWKFAKENGQVVTKSVKGNSIVILDESSYYTNGYQFLSSDGFSKSLNDNETEFKNLKSFLLLLKNSNSIDETFYKTFS